MIRTLSYMEQETLSEFLVKRAKPLIALLLVLIFFVVYYGEKKK